MATTSWDDEEQMQIRQTRRHRSVRIGRTSVGKGVFAGRSFPDQAIIGEIKGELIDDPGYESEYCFDLENGQQLEPFPPFRFVNHSCEPNCDFEFFDEPNGNDGKPKRIALLCALREIKPGEELTIDYNWPADAAIPCRCRAPSCRQWIVDVSHLPQLVADAADDP